MATQTATFDAFRSPALRTTHEEPPSAVVECYDFLDQVVPDCGVRDLTDGIYLDPHASFEEAQHTQAKWLLDEVGCRAGSRFLDIGCGYGRLLELAGRRGAMAIGISISPGQVARCHARNLDVRLLDYRHIPEDWNGQFDCIAANGSIEHFVQPSDVAAGRADAVYRQMFEICHQLLKPLGRLVTTVIHRRDSRFDLSTAELRRDPLSFGWGSAKFHYRMLQECFGGSYPYDGQLAKCAAGKFTKLNEVDGTSDYQRTAEQGVRQIRSRLRSLDCGPRIWRNLAKFCLRQPQEGVSLLVCMLVTQSWEWQFRGALPPTKLLRQTWQREDVSLWSKYQAPV